MKLSIDLGGTNVRIAQVENGICLNKMSVPCLAQQDASAVLDQLFQLITGMMNVQVDGIGIGVPSIVDVEKGIVYNVANISSWKKIHLKDILCVVMLYCVSMAGKGENHGKGLCISGGGAGRG